MRFKKLNFYKKPNTLCEFISPARIQTLECWNTGIADFAILANGYDG